ncbi:subclass B3 metallo-beta-lactamase BJP-1 [Mucilaginibacter puniceus]
MTPIKKQLQLMFLAAFLLFGLVAKAQQKFAPFPVMQQNWRYEYKPFQVVGNLYYVGTYDLACYLITTPQGHILINTGLAEETPMLIKHITDLGFKVADIKILLTTHGHYDHVAGMAQLKALTKAKVMVNEYDAQVLEDGGKSDYAFGENGATFEPVKVDVKLHDGDLVKLGGMEIKALHHPGHTKGATGFLFDVKDKDKTYKVFIANMPTVLDQTNLANMPTYPNVAKDYATTFEKMKAVQFDLWLASHAAQFNMHTKHKPDDPYNPEVFRDRAGYDAAINRFYNLYLRKLNSSK